MYYLSSITVSQILTPDPADPKVEDDWVTKMTGMNTAIRVAAIAQSGRSRIHEFTEKPYCNIWPSFIVFIPINRYLRISYYVFSTAYGLGKKQTWILPSTSLRFVRKDRQVNIKFYLIKLAQGQKHFQGAMEAQKPSVFCFVSFLTSLLECNCFTMVC